MLNKKIVPIFFATDDNYIPFVGVAIKSLLDNASKDNFYNIHILTSSGISSQCEDLLKKHLTPNSSLIIDYVDLYIKKIEKNLFNTLRDYYTLSIFYRLFIADLYPTYSKAIYLDCDIVVLGDISKLYNIDIENNIFGVVVDDVINNNSEFCNYARNGVGVDPKKYFNSGVLLIDLNNYRRENVLNRFVYLLTTFNFKTAAPDQDYLNVICKDKVKYLDRCWDLMPVGELYQGEINLIHYNNFYKPWFYDDVLYGEYFWEYARKTVFYNDILKIKNSFNEDMKNNHIRASFDLIKQTREIAESDNNFKKILFNDFGFDY